MLVVQVELNLVERPNISNALHAMYSYFSTWMRHPEKNSLRHCSSAAVLVCASGRQAMKQPGARIVFVLTE